MQGQSFSFHGQDFGNFEYKTADHYQKVILIYKKKKTCSNGTHPHAGHNAACMKGKKACELYRNWHSRPQ